MTLAQLLWDYGPEQNAGSSQIPSGQTLDHVTGIELGLCQTDSSIFTMRIIGAGASATAFPSGGCTELGTTQVLSIGTDQRVTAITVWKSANLRIYRMLVSLKDLSTWTLTSSWTTSSLEYLVSNSGQLEQPYSYSIPQGYEFSGLSIGSTLGGCIISYLQVIYRPLVCTVTFDLSQVDGLSQSVVTGVSQYRLFTKTSNPGLDCQTAAFNYRVYYSPGTNITYMITMGSSSFPQSIYFQKSPYPEHEGIYTVYVEAAISGIGNYLAPPGIAQYTYTGACSTTTISVSSLIEMTNSIQVSGSPSYTTQTATASDSASVAYAKVPLLCGAITFSISTTTSVAALSTTELTISSTGVIQLYTSNSAAIGTHTATVSASLAEFSAITPATSTFTIIINPCIVTSFTMSTLASQTYYIPNSELSWSLVGSSIITQVPACGHTLTLTSSPTPAFITTVIAGSTISYSAFSQSFTDVGLYPITVTATLNNYDFNPPRTAPTQQSTFTFLATGSCSLTPTYLMAPSISQMETSVLVQSGGSPFYVSQTVVFKDSISVALGNDVVTCGDRQYTISSTPSSGIAALISTELTIDPTTGLIKVYTANKAAVGVHTGTVRATLVSYTTVAEASSTFSIKINPCILTAFTMSPLSAQSYTIGNPSLIWSIIGSSVITQVPACGYTSTFSSHSVPSFVSAFPGATITFVANSRDNEEAKSYSIIVKNDLDNYPYTSPPTPQQTITLKAINPCLTSTNLIIPSTIETLVAFAGQIVFSQRKFKFTDSASIFYSQGQGAVDFCGEKQLAVTLNGTSTTMLSAFNNDIIKFQPPSNTVKFGVGQARITVSMKSHPTVASVSISFQVTILGSIVPKIQDQVYQWGSKTLQITFEPFKIQPSNYDAGPSTVQGYIYTGTTMPKVLDLACECLVQVGNFSWIQFDSYANTLSVLTSNAFHLGRHTVVLVQFFDKFPGVNPFTSFSVTIQPVDKPPYFQSELVTLNVKQCQNKEETFWKFSLPKIMDPNNQTVSPIFNFDPTLFTYDKIEKKIKQTRFVQVPRNESIYITLDNQLVRKATYSLDIYFYCDVTDNSTLNSSDQLNQSEVAVNKNQLPRARVSQIEPSGLLHVKFFQTMKVPDDEQLLLMNETVKEIINLELVPGRFSDPQMMKFNWTLVNFTTNELLIQLDFENLSYISSASGYPDSLNLTITRGIHFVDIRGNLMPSPTTLQQKALPQLATKAQIQAATTHSGQTKTIMSGAVVFLFLSGPAQKILSSFKHSQIVVHLMLIQVSFPAVVLVFFGGLMNLINFQLVDLTNVYNTIFFLDPQSDGSIPLNSQFLLMGYGSLYIVQNFGMLLLTILLPFLARILTYLIVRISRGRFSRFTNWKSRAEKWLNYGFWVSFFDETYLFLLICSFLNIGYYFQWKRYGEGINCLIALVSIILLLIFPFFVPIFYSKSTNQDLILKGDSNFKERFGSVIHGLNFKRRGGLALFYPCMQLFRKLWLAYILVFQKDRNLLCIFSVIVQSLIMIGVTGLAEPMTDISENRMQMFNEFFILVFVYHLFPLTNFMTNLDVRNDVGNSLMIMTLINFCCNILLTALQNLPRCITKVKIWFKKLKNHRKVKLCFKSLKNFRDRFLRIKRQQLVFAADANQQQQELAESPEIELNEFQLRVRQTRAERAIQNSRDAQFELVQLEEFNIDEFFQHSQVSQTEISPDQLDHRGRLLRQLKEYSDPNLNEDNMSASDVRNCQNIVYENQLGVDLRPLGRIQGPFQAQVFKQSGREVIFDFNRQLSQKDMWSRQKQTQMVQEAVSNFLAPIGQSGNFIEPKFKKSFFQKAKQIVPKNVGHASKLFLQLQQSSNSKHKFLNRNDSLDNLKKTFGDLVQQKVVATRTTEFQKRKLEVYLIKVDVEFVRFGVLVDGKDTKLTVSDCGENSQSIEQKLIKLMKAVDKLTQDFPKTVYEDVLSGKFAERIARYQTQWAGRRPQDFVDFGQIPDGMEFEQLVMMYQKIRNSDQQKSEKQKMYGKDIVFFN